MFRGRTTEVELLPDSAKHVGGEKLFLTKGPVVCWSNLNVSIHKNKPSCSSAVVGGVVYKRA